MIWISFPKASHICLHLVWPTNLCICTKTLLLDYVKKKLLNFKAFLTYYFLNYVKQAQKVLWLLVKYIEWCVFNCNAKFIGSKSKWYIKVLCHVQWPSSFSPCYWTQLSLFFNKFQLTFQHQTCLSSTCVFITGCISISKLSYF